MTLGSRFASGFALTSLALLLRNSASFAGSTELPPPGERDHLTCYRVDESQLPQRYVADLHTLLGVEESCRVHTPPRFFCTETAKEITGRRQPPGGGPEPRPAGHFLCYTVVCPGDEVPEPVNVEDQFGRHRIVFERERVLCAPGDVSFCGDGNIDPGEQCDGDANLCAAPCLDDCTCDFDVCCQCANQCSMGAFCVIDECPPGPPGSVCNEASGLCEEECPCGSRCALPGGVAGRCQRGSRGCECRDLPIGTAP